MKLKEALRLIDTIKFKSIDKDNMEFEAKLTYSQVDAIRELHRVAHYVDKEGLRI